MRLGLLYNILKVGQNWSMGKCQISKMTLFDFTHRFPLTSVTLTLSIFTINKKILDFYPDFQGQPFTRHPHHPDHPHHPLSLDHFSYCRSCRLGNVHTHWYTLVHAFCTYTVG